MPIQVDRIASGLATPTYAASAPGDPDRLFIAEKNTGRIVILDLTTNTVLPQPFFDIPADQMSNGDTQGLLGFAFHPDYATNGKFYLSFNNELQDSEIWEVTRSSSDPDVADPASARVVLQIDRLNLPLHNGGWIDFGPDGLLYVPTGDSAARGGFNLGDPQNAAQNINDLRGKLLRIDVDRDDFPADPARNYGIPDGNPFIGVDGADEVFAFGLRNPWRASFDRATGDLYIGNVGEDGREEIEFLPVGTGAGTNFGWRVMEGTRPTGFAQEGNPPPFDPSFTPPLLEYTHGLGNFQGFSVTGGYVYRGPGDGQGHYFFADHVSNHIWTTRVVNGQATEWVQRDAQLVVDGGTLDQIVSFAEDGEGRLYALGLDGEIFRISPDSLPPGVTPPVQQQGSDSDFLDDAGTVLLIGALIFGAFWL